MIINVAVKEEVFVDLHFSLIDFNLSLNFMLGRIDD